MLNGRNIAMADRTSAQIFGEIFELLADYKAANPTPSSFSVLVEDVLSLTNGYDFSQWDMDCDEALKSLSIDTGDEND